MKDREEARRRLEKAGWHQVTKDTPIVKGDKVYHVSDALYEIRTSSIHEFERWGDYRIRRVEDTLQSDGAWDYTRYWYCRKPPKAGIVDATTGRRSVITT